MQCTASIVILIGIRMNKVARYRKCIASNVIIAVEFLQLVVQSEAVDFCRAHLIIVLTFSF